MERDYKAEAIAYLKKQGLPLTPGNINHIQNLLIKRADREMANNKMIQHIQNPIKQQDPELFRPSYRTREQRQQDILKILNDPAEMASIRRQCPLPKE